MKKYIAMSFIVRLMLYLAAPALLVQAGNVGAQQLANSPWPMHRGNLQHTGLSPYLTDHVEGSVKWSHQPANECWADASPVIGPDGTIFYACHDLVEQNGKLYAVNPDGTSKWAEPFVTGQGEYHNEMWRSIQATPAIASDGTIYLVALDDKLYALNPDGSPKWPSPFTIDVSENIWSSPAIGDDGTIYVGSHDDLAGKLYAINPNGTEKWKFPTQSDVSSSPAISSDGSTIYVGSGDGHLYAIDTDGEELWRFDVRAPGELWVIQSSPAIGSDGTIYVGAGMGTVGGVWEGRLFAITPDGNERWRFPAMGTLGSEVRSSPAIGPDGTIYVGTGSGTDNNLYAIYPDGTEKWHFTADDQISTSPAVGADGTIYVGSNDHNLYAIDSENGQEKWRLTILCCGWAASVAIGGNGTIYAANDKLYALDAFMDEKLKATDAQGGDLFGSSVAISGSTIAVGAPRKNSQKGQGYIFQHNGTGFAETAKLTAGDGKPKDGLGGAIGISGNAVVAGAGGDDTYGNISGAAYVFHFDGTGWNEAAKLTAGATYADAEDHFGHSVAIQDSLLVVGAAWDDDTPTGDIYNAGSVYVFEYDPPTESWQPRGKLNAPEPKAGTLFGFSVAIDAGRILVGSLGERRAYLFYREGDQIVSQTLSPYSETSTSSFDAFGGSVALSGRWIVVGASEDDFDGKVNAGSVYVFNHNEVTKTIEPEIKLTANDAADDALFGLSVAVSGERIVSGAPNTDSFLGAVYVFENDGTQWQQTRLTGYVPEQIWGHPVDISSDLVLVGERLDSEIASRSGAVHLYPIQFNTPVSGNSAVVVRPLDDASGKKPVQLTFSSITQAGNTTLVSTQVGPAVPSGLMMGDPQTYFEISTTATFEDEITVCIDYSGTDFKGREEDLRVYHYEDNAWTDVTDLPVDIENNIICGSVTSLSSFAILERTMMDVEIDIRPFSRHNVIVPWTWGLVPVAILSTSDFDATYELDRKSLTFGATGVEQSMAFCVRGGHDVNRDGFDDLIAFFRTQKAGFQVGDSVGVLRGYTLDGLPIEGSDSVKIKEKKKGVHWKQRWESD